MQLHKPEQPINHIFNTRIDFFNEAKIYIKITPAQQESGVCTCVAFVFKDSLLSSVLQERVSPKSLIGLEFRSR